MKQRLSLLILLLGLCVPCLASAQLSTQAQRTLEQMFCPSGKMCKITLQGSTAPAVSSAGQAVLYFDSSTNVTRLSQNGGAYATLSTGGATGLANPSGTIGLAAVNGSATTAIRSDGAPALSQAIDPTWTGTHIFTSAKIKIAGTSSGTVTFAVPAAAGTNTITWPAGTTDFSATGGTSQVLQQASAGAAITVGQLAASHLSNGTTGSGAVVLASGATLSTPTLGVATGTSFNSITGLANPTGTIGLTAVNGTATSVPRSDSAPALSQAIAPTWTGKHIWLFTPTEADVHTLIQSNSGTNVRYGGSNILNSSNNGVYLTVGDASYTPATYYAKANWFTLAGTGTIGLRFGAATRSDDLVITSDGVVGAGTASPLSTAKLDINGDMALVGVRAMGTATPTISSGFGTSPSVTAGKAWAFTLNVGTGGTASAGVIAMGSTAATGWACHVENQTGVAANRADQRTVQTASAATTVSVQNQTISTGAALAWTASDVLRVGPCVAY